MLGRCVHHLRALLCECFPAIGVCAALTPAATRQASGLLVLLRPASAAAAAAVAHIAAPQTRTACTGGDAVPVSVEW